MQQITSAVLTRFVVWRESQMFIEDAMFLLLDPVTLSLDLQKAIVLLPWLIECI